MIVEGSYDKVTDAITTFGTMLDPSSGKDMKVKQVLTKVTEDLHTYKMFIVQGNSEMKSTEITYVRKK